MRACAGKVLVSACDAAVSPRGDRQPDPDGEAKLRRAFTGTPYATASIELASACQSTTTPADTMLLGRDPTRSYLAWAAALGLHGATASAAVGEVVAASLASAL